MFSISYRKQKNRYHQKNDQTKECCTELQDDPFHKDQPQAEQKREEKRHEYR
jgi:hypothetical protein